MAIRWVKEQHGGMGYQEDHQTVMDHQQQHQKVMGYQEQQKKVISYQQAYQEAHQKVKLTDLKKLPFKRK